MNKLTVGQTVYLKPINNAARGSSEIRQEVITKIGKKFFYAGERNERFYIETMFHDAGEYSSRYKAYLSVQTITEEKEANVLNDFICNYFSYKGTPRLPLDKLRKIKEIIES